MEACYYDSLGVHTLTVEFLCCWLFLFILDCCIQHYQVVDQYLHSGFVIRAWRTVTVASNFQLSHKKNKKYSNVWSMNFIRLFCHSTSEFRTAATVECIKGLDTLHFSVHWLPCECGRQETQAHANLSAFLVELVSFAWCLSWIQRKSTVNLKNCCIAIKWSRC